MCMCVRAREHMSHFARYDFLYFGGIDGNICIYVSRKRVAYWLYPSPMSDADMLRCFAMHVKQYRSRDRRV